MKKLKAMLLVAGCLAALGLSTGKLQAQGRGNFDPAQFRQDMLDRYKDRLEVKDDGEWKLIEAALGKVFDAQRDVMSSRMNGMMRRNRGGNGGGDAGGAGADTAAQNNRPRGGFGGTPPPEADD
ncbi:MAG: hypothetical protein JWQ04_270, partial [Pedosphaera sp.]|nr:hypothetical protein [Pedosphaera sp.]